jgi:hypothetical protein
MQEIKIKHLKLVEMSLDLTFKMDKYIHNFLKHILKHLIYIMASLIFL